VRTPRGGLLERSCVEVDPVVLVPGRDVGREDAATAAEVDEPGTRTGRAGDELGARGGEPVQRGKGAARRPPLPGEVVVLGRVVARAARCHDRGHAGQTSDAAARRPDPARARQ